jgi:cystathionine beta-lyase/cystathionine gamma-synthase
MTNGSLSFVPRDRLEEALALLEGARLARTFASGLAAVDTLVRVTPIAKTCALARAKSIRTLGRQDLCDSSVATPHRARRGHRSARAFAIDPRITLGR